MNNLKDIHNICMRNKLNIYVVLSGFQWTIWRIYTTRFRDSFNQVLLFYQDFNEQFEGYTQPRKFSQVEMKRCFIRISMNNLKDIHNLAPAHAPVRIVVLSGFQWTIWRIYTTIYITFCNYFELFYQDFNEQFEGYTQHYTASAVGYVCCFIRISMNNLKDIHN